MKFLQAFTFYTLCSLYTIFLGIIALPTLFIPHRKYAVFFQKLWAKGLLAMLSAICGVKMRVMGKEYIKTNNVIFASKHQSAFETIALAVLCENPIFVLKKSLLFLPVIGLYIKKIGMITVAKKGGAKVLKDMLHQCEQRVKEGCSIVIFPEGHRSDPYAKPKKYHTGIAALYERLPQATVVPVALNSGLSWGRNSFLKHACVVTIKFLPPMEAGLPRAEFMKQLYEVIETESEKLLPPK